MLVLSRKPTESIHIGDDIVVTVARISGSRVQLAVQAPRHVPVMRAELIDRRQVCAHAGGRGEVALDAAHDVAER